MKEHNEVVAEEIRDVAKCFEMGIIDEERAREQIKDIIDRPVQPEIEFNINWYAEVVLNESGRRSGITAFMKIYVDTGKPVMLSGSNCMY